MELEKDGVIILGVVRPDTRDPAWKKTRAAIREHALPYPTLVDQDARLLRAFEVEAYPHLVIIDRQGIVRLSEPGARGAEALRAALKQAGA